MQFARIDIKKISGFLLAAIITLQIVILFPQIGHGFIKDDFNWIENAAPGGKVDLLYSFSNTTGFFRPMVGVSFGLQFQLFGLDPKPYALFNLVLHLGNMILVFLLLKRVTKSDVIALIVVFFSPLILKGASWGWGGYRGGQHCSLPFSP